MLKDFLNAVLTDSDYPPLCEVRVRNPHNLSAGINQRESILDVKATDESGRLFDIEIQAIEDTRFTERTLYYWAEIYAKQIKRGESFDMLKPVICINVLNFILDRRHNDVHSEYHIVNKRHPNLALSGAFGIHYLEIPKFKGTGKPVKRALYEWLAFLKDGANEEVFMEYLINDPHVLRAEEKFKNFTLIPPEQDAYEAHMKWVSMSKDLVADSFTKGVAEGKSSGKEEKARETAINLKKEHISVEIIMRATGLSKEEIENL